MNELSSNEVPQKLTEWLLSMGCHPEIVPPVEKVAEKCRGQYYMVWRSLMEKVESRHVIQKKRPQVFCDDIWKSQKKNALHERDSNIVAEELQLWHRHTELKEKVAEAEARLNEEKENLRQAADKANSKLCQRHLLQKRLQERQRSALLLQKVAKMLKEEKQKLVETKTITGFMCRATDADIESNLDQCIASLTRQGSGGKASQSSGVNCTANSTIASSSSDNSDEEAMASLAKCHGEMLFKQLNERRAALCHALSATHPEFTTNTRGPRVVVGHTAALVCRLALEATKNRFLADRARDKLAKAFLHLCNHESSEMVELLVSRCEVAYFEARGTSLKASAEDLASRTGAFAVEQPQEKKATASAILAVDKSIDSKKDELRRLTTSVVMIERKTQNVRECLLSCFNSFHDNEPEGDRYRGLTSPPQDLISTIRHFYEEERQKRKKNIDLSMNLDNSDNCSFNELSDNASPTFVHELKLYLDKFSLEKNRKFVMGSGKKVWIFECTSSSLLDLLDKWQAEDATSFPLQPCVTLRRTLRRLADDVERKGQMDALRRSLERERTCATEIDISTFKDEEQKILDKIKKSLRDNIVRLQKTSKNLDVCVENAQLWADNTIRKYISHKRTINGKCYMQYERAYLNG